MECLCFTCSLHRHKEIEKQTRLFAEAVYYATSISEAKYQLRLLEGLGYKIGHLSDEGVEGEMAAIDCDLSAYESLLDEIMKMLDLNYRELVKRIYAGDGGEDAE